MPELRDRPLVRWGDELRRRGRARRKRHQRARLAALAALAVVVLTGPMVAPPDVRLVWNASASAPIGLYWLSPRAPIRQGDMVVTTLPAAAREMAARRGYVPSNVPLVKRVAATQGDHVCAAGPSVYVNGALAARRREADAFRRPMPWWSGCRHLVRGELFLLMGAQPQSFDSRYFGPVRAANLLGQARLL
ncbi:MAG TPA: conjugative transfer signal peptidase TraF [Sphingomonadaceae bacterium]|nr:conjugative transfer signal peptidase TraF [Sphingomonadaceae bacterium]